ncbi:MAG: hypothetical protein ACK4WF_01175 [Candidatus Brocadiales bacterium]
MEVKHLLGPSVCRDLNQNPHFTLSIIYTPKDLSKLIHTIPQKPGGKSIYHSLTTFFPRKEQYLHVYCPQLIRRAFIKYDEKTRLKEELKAELKGELKQEILQEIQEQYVLVPKNATGTQSSNPIPVSTGSDQSGGGVIERGVRSNPARGQW